MPRPYYIGRYEVTQEEWQRVMGVNPSLEGEGGRYPVNYVPWEVLQEFLSKTGFRLPTENEWEYACRFGSGSQRYGQLDDIAWHIGHPVAGFPAVLHEVGMKTPNPLGLYDMFGNVAELTSDRLTSDDPSWVCETYYVGRGCPQSGWDHEFRASFRYVTDISERDCDLGVRVVRDP